MNEAEKYLESKKQYLHTKFSSQHFVTLKDANNATRIQDIETKIKELETREVIPEFYSQFLKSEMEKLIKL